MSLYKLPEQLNETIVKLKSILKELYSNTQITHLEKEQLIKGKEQLKLKYYYLKFYEFHVKIFITKNNYINGELQNILNSIKINLEN